MPSLSHRSFGTYVGRLAGLPASVLERADERSEWMREKAKRRWISHLRNRIGADPGGHNGWVEREAGDHDIVDLLSAVTRVKVM
jgi:DNA mismatch repair ATPase MutS